jgi:hypothetical protein
MEQYKFARPEGPTHGIISFLFRCPPTGFRVQGWLPDNSQERPPDTYEPVSCPACGGTHLVEARSGRVLGRS